METWRKTWRKGVASRLEDGSLARLADVLRRDDPAWTQGVTVVPPPLPDHRDEPPAKACALGQCAIGAGAATVGDIDDWFADASKACDGLTGEEDSIRYVTNWHDESPRETVRLHLLAEVEHEQAQRAGKAGAA